MVNGHFNGTLGIAGRRSRKMRMRFVAANAFSMYTISIDGLNLTVIEVDGTSVTPYQVRMGSITSDLSTTTPH